MDWMKILSKGWTYVKTIIIIIAIGIITINVIYGSGDDSDYSIREDIKSIRDNLVVIEGQTSDAIGIINEVIDYNERIVGGLDRLSIENTFARDIARELGDDNTEYARRIREVQDITLDSELTIDGLRKLITRIERENDYSSGEE